MRSGSLWATKLHVVGVSKSRDFETVISSTDGSLQYRIGTKVEAWSIDRIQRQEIEAPDWLLVPPAHIHVREGGKLFLSCAALAFKGH